MAVSYDSTGMSSAPSTATCAGNTVQINSNIRIQSNAQGTITSIGVRLTGPYGYSNGPLSVAPNTILGVGLGGGGALTIAVSSPIYYSPVWGIQGAYISSATYNNGAFTHVNGARATIGIPWGSTQTPSSYLLNKFNSNSSLSNLAGQFQAAAQLAQQLVGCSVVTGG